ncbi:MAG: zf-HC2 domain-containing protein [Candidatus Delongbacteria bacterium]|nr:zf-HC2 domain-containing protein [Candidatus Delongbacteria bacterium]MBN2834244.1 zf-HC2 domain-containing protein [Candidatus Delongbacteria bacterium]
MECPKKEEMQKYYDNELSDIEMMEVSKHVENCTDCQKSLAELDTFVKFIKTEIPAKMLVKNYKRNNNLYYMGRFATVAAMIVMLVISYNFIIEKPSKDIFISYDESLDLDPNELFNNRTILFTISDKEKNENWNNHYELYDTDPNKDFNQRKIRIEIKN